MKAFKLININGSDCSFLEGTIPEITKINSDYFFTQKTIEAQFSHHPAPRYQFVITIKGKLKFTVTDGRSFIIEPGTILIAKDLLGKGHTWEIIDGTEWHRVYVVPNADDADYFVPLKK